ncbi:hypothetical protein [Streptomyces sp. Amel2xC10]|uniref:hypothetical protein n=1 Tax=Streptomyces sp. Amel2xC10 TaxID=1305826 RepID=UPI000A091070|nr:hypothetical protein [Streptomyces sp. Amel2xC10]SMF79451.1 hypothetical protein SAMN02745830_06191 [Streptomyces sp. Amel2xC10]
MATNPLSPTALPQWSDISSVHADLRAARALVHDPCDLPRARKLYQGWAGGRV